jgi:multicomponent Na+:H+ antiporter subunit D
MSEGYSLIFILLTPLLGGILLLLAHARPNIRESITLVTALLLFLQVGRLIVDWQQGIMPATVGYEWMPGLLLLFKVDSLGLIFAALASLLWIVNSIYSIGYMRGKSEKHQTRFYFFFTVAISSAMGIALSGNMLTLFFFYEALTLSTYPLVTHKGDQKTIQSARVYLGILLVTSVGLLLPAIIWTNQVAGGTEFQAGGILAGKLSPALAGILLALYLFGIGKAALMPFHRWLPAAMVAPTPVSALLHAVAVVKAGVFTVIKVVTLIFGLDFLSTVPMTDWLLVVACFTVVAASAVALRQDNLKRLLAYSTIGQLAYVVLAALLINPTAEIGASLHMIAHGFGKITLFFAAGAIYVAAKKTEISQLNGIGRVMPITMVAFAIGALSMIGIPPTGGFVSKWFIVSGAINVGNYLALTTILFSTALNAAYFLPIIYRAFWLEPDSGKQHGEAPWPVVLALSITAMLTLSLFFFHDLPLQLATQVLGENP